MRRGILLLVVTSLNVPIPGQVRHRAWELRSLLIDFDQLRDEFTLVIKRLPNNEHETIGPIRERTRSALRGVAPFEVKIDGIGSFEQPVTEPAPVVYFTVTSPGLERLHERLVEEFEAIPGLEGDDYVPHITLARGGEIRAQQLADLCNHEIEPLTWSVERLVFWDNSQQLPMGDIRLPA